MFPTLERLFTRTKRPSIFTRPDVIQLLFCVFIIILHLIFLSSALFEKAEYTLLDFYLKSRPNQEAHADIAIIEIDEASLQAIGRWPWPWHYHATMVRLLREWGARATVFNTVFKESSASFENEQLEEALAGAENVYLPVVLEAKPEKTYWVHSLPMVLGGEGEQKRWTHSAASLEKNVKALGHINDEPDEGGVLRRITPYLVSKNETHPYLGIRVAYDLFEKTPEREKAFLLPLDTYGRFMINWAGPYEKVFKRFSYANLIRSHQALQSGRPPVIDPADIRGKICLIALTARDWANLKVTPLEDAMPDVGVLANVMNSILTRSFIKPVSLSMNALCLALIGVAAALIFVTFRALTSFLSGLALGVVWLTFSFLIFWRTGIWFFGLQPLLVILSLFLFSTLYGHFVSSRERARLFDLATRDGLTRLYVIRYFREVLNQVTQESRLSGKPLSVILLDIDNFKPINDTYGHAAGDFILKNVAKVVQGCLRSQRPFHEADFIARYGGEEFVIMLQNTNLENAAAKAAERVRAAIEAYRYEWEGKVIPVTVSVGVATLHEDESVPDRMVRRADEALYEAKRSGKNRVCTEAGSG